MPNCQMDQKVRVVALANLRAMVERASSMAHRFGLKVGDTVVTLTYNNPDEHARDRPLAVTLPIVRKGTKDDPDAAAVLLDPGFSGRMTGPGCGTWDGEEWQAFSPIWYCPELWRDPADGRWYSHEQIAARQQKTG